MCWLSFGKMMVDNPVYSLVSGVEVCHLCFGEP